jgi:hypothetical protein
MRERRKRKSERIAMISREHSLALDVPRSMYR